MYCVTQDPPLTNHQYRPALCTDSRIASVYRKSNHSTLHSRILILLPSSPFLTTVLPSTRSPTTCPSLPSMPLVLDTASSYLPAHPHHKPPPLKLTTPLLVIPLIVG